MATEQSAVSSAVSLTQEPEPQTAELLQIWRLLDERQRADLLEVARGLTSCQQAESGLQPLLRPSRTDQT